MIRKFGSHVRSNVVGYIALFVAVATGSAYAANTVFSADIVNGEVKTEDLANGAATSAKLADGSIMSNKIKDGAIQGRDVLDNNLKGADIDEASLSSELLPAAAGARAYGHVSLGGTVTHSTNVVDTNAGGAEGHYCIRLDPAINAATAVVVPVSDNVGNDTDPLAHLSWAEPRFGETCGTNGVVVRTGVYLGDDTDNSIGDTTGDRLVNFPQPFVFVVP